MLYYIILCYVPFLQTHIHHCIVTHFLMFFTQGFGGEIACRSQFSVAR